MLSSGIAMDSLSPFFAQFTLSARVFFSGRLCGISSDHATETAGHLHVVRKGVLKILKAGEPSQVIDQPTVLFYPRPVRHRFLSDESAGTEILCSFVEFGAGMLNPLVQALPEVLIVPLASMPELGPTAELLFAEAFSNQPGRQTAVDRLAEYFIVLLLRAAMNAKLLNGGILMGLTDSRLARAISVMHKQPEVAWTLESMAEIAGMSRARFAAHFHEVVAQSMLKRGEPLKIVAPSVGYASSAALTRAFSQHIGASPTEWLSRMKSI
jgi:AraC-like DNA-binding protein